MYSNIRKGVLVDPVIVGLLVALLVGQILLAIGLVAVAYLCYRTLVRPEAPCFAAAMAQQPRFGMMSIDPSHPAYNALAKKLVAEKANASEKVDGTGNYL